MVVSPMIYSLALHLPATTSIFMPLGSALKSLVLAKHANAITANTITGINCSQKSEKLYCFGSSFFSPTALPFHSQPLCSRTGWGLPFPLWPAGGMLMSTWARPRQLAVRAENKQSSVSRPKTTRKHMYTQSVVPSFCWANLQFDPRKQSRKGGRVQMREMGRGRKRWL